MRHAHDSYRRVIANGDMRLQLFLAKHTDHLEDIPAATPMTNVKLDWDAQKWKAPVYLMEDRAFDGIAGIGAAAAGGTVGALALGPALNGVLAQSFGQISRRFVTSLGTRLAFAEQGAVAGTMVQPMGGQVIGAAIGVAIGVVADYLSNAANEAFNRDEFVAANDGGARCHYRHLEVDADRQYRHGHRQMVRRRARRASCSPPNSLRAIFFANSRGFRGRARFPWQFPFAAICLAQGKPKANGDGRHRQRHCAAGGEQVAARGGPQGARRGGRTGSTRRPTFATARSRGSSCSRRSSRSVFAEIPANDDRFTLMLVPSRPARLWIDLFTYVAVEDASGAYLFIRNSENGRRTLFSSASVSRDGRPHHELHGARDRAPRAARGGAGRAADREERPAHAQAPSRLGMGVVVAAFIIGLLTGAVGLFAAAWLATRWP